MRRPRVGRWSNRWIALHARHVDAEVRAGEAVDAALQVHLEPLVRHLDRSFGAAVLADLPPFAAPPRAELGVDDRLVARQGAVEVHLAAFARPAHADVLERSPVPAGRVPLEMGHRQERVGVGDGAGHELLVQVVPPPLQIDDYVVGPEPAVGHDDRAADRALVEAVPVCGLQVVHGQGPADPGVVGHRRRIGDEGAEPPLLEEVDQGADDHGPEVPDVVRLAHVGLDRHDVAPLEVVQPARAFEDLAALDGRRFEKPPRPRIHEPDFRWCHASSFSTTQPLPADLLDPANSSYLIRSAPIL